MLRTRIIPCLSLLNLGLVKTIKFQNPRYIGDPINAIKLFNDLEVDELAFVDISATRDKKGINFSLINKIVSECFMPLAIGGGVKTISDIKSIIKLGVEKVIINSEAAINPSFIMEASDILGKQSVVVSIDVKKNIFGKYQVFIESGTICTKYSPVDFAILMEEMGAGEILLNSIDRDGMMKGYDIDIIRKVSENINIPLVALGGAGSLNDFKQAIEKGNASAVSSGSMFVYHGKKNGILINYPTQEEQFRLFK